MLPLTLIPNCKSFWQCYNSKIQKLFESKLGLSCFQIWSKSNFSPPFKEVSILNLKIWSKKINFNPPPTWAPIFHALPNYSFSSSHPKPPYLVGPTHLPLPTRAVPAKLEALYETKKMRPIISWIKYIRLKKNTSIRRRIKSSLLLYIWVFVLSTIANWKWITSSLAVGQQDIFYWAIVVHTC